MQGHGCAVHHGLEDGGDVGDDLLDLWPDVGEVGAVFAALKLGNDVVLKGTDVGAIAFLKAAEGLLAAVYGREVVLIVVIDELSDALCDQEGVGLVVMSHKVDPQGQRVVEEGIKDLHGGQREVGWGANELTWRC